MPSVETKYFGTLSYSEGSIFDFPQGLPGFEEEKRFVLIELPDRAPLVFLQSLTRSSLCFPAFPILVVDEGYELAIAPEDLQALDLNVERQPAVGSEVMVLALVSLHDKSHATANLMAPLVLHLEKRRGLQAIRRDSHYSHVHLLGAQPRTAEQLC